MGFLDKLTGGYDKTIGDMASDRTEEVIKMLSGSDIKSSKKLPDGVILFSGAAGGTGVSTLVSNVAFTAMKKGFKVLVMDVNIICPVQHMYFGVEDTVGEKPDLVSYLLGKNDLAESVVTSSPVNILYASDRGLHESIKCDDKVAIDNFNQLIKTCKRLYDIVLIDCPMRTDNMLCNVAMYNAECIYLVWDEGISSVTNVEKIRAAMSASGIDAYTKVRAILNKRTDVPYTNFPFSKLNIELVETLPFTTDVIESSLKAEIFVDKGLSSGKNSVKFARAIDSLTEKVVKIGGYLGEY